MRTWTEKLNVEKKIKVVRLEKNQGYPRGQQNAGCYTSYRRCVCPKNSQRTFDFLSDYARGFGTRTQSRQNLPGID